MRRVRHLHRHLHIHTKHHKHKKKHPRDITIYESDSLSIKIQKTWERFGPGIITGASDDDPSGIATYSQAGAKFGFQTLWTALLSFPLMAAIQEMCGRIGMVTNMGLTSVIKKHYPKWVIYLVGFISIPAMILNIAADLAGMGAVSNMIFPAIPSWVFIIISALLIIFSVILFSYKRLEQILKWLCLALLVYFVVPFFIKLDWGLILKSTFNPRFEFTKEYIGIIVAILGTTISPYLFFWEASMEVEEQNQRRLKTDTGIAAQITLENPEVTKQQISEMRQDSNLGMFLSNLTMFFIILTTGSVLFYNGITNITTVQDAAAALKPIAGDFAYILFAVGVIGTGLLTIPVLAGVCGYIISEMFDWKEGMNNKFKQARGFYEVIAFSILLGLGLNISGMDPIQSLIWSAIIYGVTAPILIAIILLIANREDIMGKWKNGWISNLLGGAGLVLMSVAVMALFYTTFF